MNLQPLYEIKDRLEHAALSGTGLLHEDFHLKRAAENLKPLAAASPVFSRLDSGLQGLLSAPPEARAALLLDVLALTGAVLYTQAKTGVDGELEPLPVGTGTLCPLSYGQARPLLDALTGSGGGRLETVKSAWAEHPEFFADFRILPAVAAGLGDSYGALADFNGEILKKIGSAALPLLKQGFDPAGKKDMARRVETIAAIEGPAATPWLREVLPQAKKDVRSAVLAALGNDPDNAALLLDLVKTERGKHRDAVLEALARQDGEEVRAFWTAELARKPEHAEYLQSSRAAWARGLTAAAFRAILERPLRFEGQDIQLSENDLSALNRCRPAILGNDSPAMLDCWRWIDSQIPAFSRMKRGPNVTHVDLGTGLPSWLLDCLCYAGPGPLCGLSRELWEAHRAEHSLYLPHALIAALLTRPAAEVFEEFSPYIAVEEPEPQAFNLAMSRHTALLKGLERLGREDGQFLVDNVWPAVQPLDKRWFLLLTQTRQRFSEQRSPYIYRETVDALDTILIRLADPSDREICEPLITYLRRRLEETGQAHTYSRWLFELGGSPRGILGTAMAKNPTGNRLAVVWDLLDKAARALPVEETAALMEEILDSGGIYKDAQPMANKALPWTIEQLRVGKPFPTWDEWLKFHDS